MWVMKSVNWLTIIIHHFPKIVTFTKDYYMINGVCVSENIYFQKFKSLNRWYLLWSTYKIKGENKIGTMKKKDSICHFVIIL